MNGGCPPVLFLVFNRPDLTEASLEAIRRAQPRELFIAADGPRENRQDEEMLCQEVRRFAQEVDWDCRVRTLFRDRNLGCRKAVSEAITWFFEQVDSGVIIEDDCVPELSFFRFCDELLDRYRDDLRVMNITGNNFQDGATYGNESYYFSNYFHCWGWATWRRAWTHYDANLSLWGTRHSRKSLSHLSTRAQNYWANQLDLLKNCQIDTWDYAWMWSCWAKGGLTCTPQKNLVRNIGFDERATHTTCQDALESQLLANEMEFPLVHPEDIAPLGVADSYVTNRLIGANPQADATESPARAKLRSLFSRVSSFLQKE